MPAATTTGDVLSPRSDAPIRLRVQVYDALAASKGAKTVVAQAALHGMHRSHMFSLRSGDSQPSLSLAMRMADDLGVRVEDLFERVAEGSVAA